MQFQVTSDEAPRRKLVRPVSLHEHRRRVGDHCPHGAGISALIYVGMEGGYAKMFTGRMASPFLRTESLSGLVELLAIVTNERY